MEVTRTRFSSTGEWVTTTLFLAATLVVGALIVRELRVAPQAFSAASPDAATATVPPEAVSVPALMLDPTHEIRVGDRLADALARLDPAVGLVKQTTERGPLGAREVRTYEVGGTRFLLVAEPFERRGELRIAAIYLQ